MVGCQSEYLQKIDTPAELFLINLILADSKQSGIMGEVSAFLEILKVFESQ